MKNRPSRLFIVSFTSIITAFSTVLWLCLFIEVGSRQKTAQTEMLMEVAKILGQMVFVTVLGATLTFLYNQYAKEQEQHKLQLQEDNKLRRELLDSVIAVRAQVEETRREYRLLAVREKQTGYEGAIQNLLKARLRLSQVWHDAETWKELYSDHPNEIQCGLQGMKAYLDSLILEYETVMESFREADEEKVQQAISKLPHFGAFVRDEGGPTYTKEFLERDYRNVARIIRQYILKAPE